jgi:hypothetical protein
MRSSGAATWPEKKLYSKASTVSLDPHGKAPDPWIYSPDLQVGPGPPRVRTGPLEWDPGGGAPPAGGGGGPGPPRVRPGPLEWEPPPPPPRMGSGPPTVGSQGLT